MHLPVPYHPISCLVSYHLSTYTYTHTDAPRPAPPARFIPEAVASPFGGGAIVEGAPLSEFPGELYLICRAVLILRGICHALGMTDVVLADLWLTEAEESLGDMAGLQARAARNAALLGDEL